MLELSLIGVIGLAALYWTALWWMGRHEDVLYGHFVNPSDSAAPRTSVEPAQGPPVDIKSMLQTAPRKTAARKTPARTIFLPDASPLSRLPTATAAMPAQSAVPAAITAAPGIKLPSADSATARPRHAPTAAATRHDALASLLETIKRDLNDSVGKP
uniref:Uncharacterized protein n=1 Tax=Rhodopseudomonas palustris (strain DX-1) TaxID=652103 RepID=E6VG23_RHOPX